jgi:adenine-specific DNA-methyltransferase
MTRNKSEPIQTETRSITEEQCARLRELFPEAFTEDKIDFEKLRAALGDLLDDGPERYQFTWAGKRDAIRLLQTPTRATLVPCREESVNFDQTQHLFIEGDNLEVLKLLYKAYFGRVKMIYIDPPYNTGNDFIYPDDYTDPLATYLQLTGQQDTEGNLLTSNPETSGRYHSAWLSMMYPRLFLARQLLQEDGVIFVSIDDHEVHNLRLLMNEVFGEENFIAAIIWQKYFSVKSTAKHFSATHEYILVYARNADLWVPELLPRTEEADSRYGNPDNDPRGSWTSGPLQARNYYSRGKYEVVSPTGKKFSPPTGTYWRVSKESFEALEKDNRIWWGEDGQNVPRLKRFLSEVKQGIVPDTLWEYKKAGHTQEAKEEFLRYIDFQHAENVLNTLKPTRLLRRILQVGTDTNAGDVVMDFFSGSAATAHSVLSQNREDTGNRRFIMVQLPEPLPEPEPHLDTIADLGKERIRRVIAQMRQGENGQLSLDLHPDEDLGFKVFKLAPSNLRAWRGVEEDSPDAYAHQMELFHDPLVDGWAVENVIYEIALKEGYGLNCRVEPVPAITGNNIYRVTDPDKEQAFTICLDNTIDLASISGLNLSRDDTFVCRDVALDDEVAANLALQCRLKTI